MNKFAKIAAIATAVAMSTPMLALAAMNSSSIVISSSNSGSISSNTDASAYTGLNTAGGSTGGEGGNGGDVEEITIVLEFIAANANIGVSMAAAVAIAEIFANLFI